MTSRRHFVISIPTAALALAVGHTATAQPAKLEEADPQAAALGYRHDATKVDAKKYSTYSAGRNCANCQLYVGKPGDAWGGCSAFGGKLVNAKGWCVAWVKKA